MLLLAIARKCGDEVEEWERAGALGIPWQRKRWSSLASLQSSYNDAVRCSLLEQFQRRSQCSRCSSRIPVTIARRGDGMIGKGAMLDAAEGMSAGNARDSMANGSPTVAPCTCIQSLTLHDPVSAVLAIHRRSPLPSQGSTVHRHREPERRKLKIVWIRLFLPLSSMSVGSQDSTVGEEA